MKKIQSIRGMNDLLPVDSPRWQYLESSISSILTSYCFNEIRFPLLESTDLFKRTIGEITDIVEKEMYTFDDRNGDSLTLRPEGTAGCVRACQQSGLIFNQIQRLWYQGPMFRHERPQKGRLRQFQQIGVEVFGLNGPDIDAELIQLVSKIWSSLGLTDHLSLQINTLGSIESRNLYRKDLIAYLDEKKHDLDVDSQRRIHTNPMRILDSKDLNTQKVLNDSPNFHDYLDEESREHFELLCSFLEKLDIAYHVNKRLVRGLDYYGKTVFEWVTTMLGAQGTICAGGRYDKLVEQMGGKSTPAVGLAMGIERLILLLDEASLFPDSIASQVDLYVIADGDITTKSIELSSYIRNSCSYLKVQSHCGGGSLKNKMKKADKSGAGLALIIDENEFIKNNITVKYLRQDQPQIHVNKEEFVKLVNNKVIKIY